MKYTLILTILLLTASCSTSMMTQGYIISIDNTAERGFDVIKTPDLSKADSIYSEHFQGCLDASGELEKNNFFFHENDTFKLYCEKGFLKYKNNGKIKFKKK